MGHQLLASFFFGDRTVDVYGCWDEATREGKFDFYDLFLRTPKTGAVCINEGEPLFRFPSWSMVRAELKEYDAICTKGGE